MTNEILKSIYQPHINLYPYKYHNMKGKHFPHPSKTTKVKNQMNL